jgi:hypothetical protein
MVFVSWRWDEILHARNGAELIRRAERRRAVARDDDITERHTVSVMDEVQVSV